MVSVQEVSGIEGSSRQTAKANVESAFTNFFEVYGAVQAVAGTRLVEAVRVYAYRL